MGEDIKRQLKVTLASDDGTEKTYSINDPVSTVTKAQVTAVFNNLINIPDGVVVNDSDQTTTAVLTTTLLLNNSDEKLTVFKNAELVITSREELS